jgi:hypothetical protein
MQFSIATHFVKDHGGVWGVSDPYLSDPSSSEGVQRRTHESADSF